MFEKYENIRKQLNKFKHYFYSLNCLLNEKFNKKFVRKSQNNAIYL